MSKKFKQLLESAQKKITIKRLDSVTFQGLVSGMMASSGGRKTMSIRDTAFKANRKMPIWDRLADQGLVTKEEIGDDEYQYLLTKKGAILANQLTADGTIYNPNKIIFSVR